MNIQRGKDGNAKVYQVRQVLDAIARLEAEKNEESDDHARRNPLHLPSHVVR